MTWYAAHVIQYFKLKHKPQTSYMVYENIFLIEADSAANAFKEAERIGQEEDAEPDETLRLNGEPAISVFGGVRKVVQCLDSVALVEDENNWRPRHGTEITYSEFYVEGEEALQALIKGHSVTLSYED